MHTPNPLLQISYICFDLWEIEILPFGHQPFGDGHLGFGSFFFSRFICVLPINICLYFKWTFSTEWHSKETKFLLASFFFLKLQELYLSVFILDNVKFQFSKKHYSDSMKNDNFKSKYIYWAICSFLLLFFLAQCYVYFWSYNYNYLYIWSYLFISY